MYFVIFYVKWYFYCKWIKIVSEKYDRDNNVVYIWFIDSCGCINVVVWVI